MQHPADYQQPAVESFDEADILGDTPEMAPTFVSGSVTQVNSAE